MALIRYCCLLVALAVLAQFFILTNDTSELIIIREQNIVNQVVLAMLGASTYKSTMMLRSLSKNSSVSRYIRVSFSIPREGMCENIEQLENCTHNSDFVVTRRNNNEFFVHAVLVDNDDLNRTCQEPSNRDRIFYVDYPGHEERPNGTEGFNDYQVWYKCGLFNELKGKLVKKDDSSWWHDACFISVIVIICILVSWFLIRTYKRESRNVQPAGENSSDSGQSGRTSHTNVNSSSGTRSSVSQSSVDGRNENGISIHLAQLNPHMSEGQNGNVAETSLKDKNDFTADECGHSEEPNSKEPSTSDKQSDKASTSKMSVDEKKMTGSSEKPSEEQNLPKTNSDAADHETDEELDDPKAKLLKPRN
uniref:Uncharacterized protein n=1 Tax=Caenorhabditis japonica TaxID=281687 RepID=A0A8R1DVQ9_CAEJA